MRPKLAAAVAQQVQRLFCAHLDLSESQELISASRVLLMWVKEDFGRHDSAFSIDLDLRIYVDGLALLLACSKAQGV